MVKTVQCLQNLKWQLAERRVFFVLKEPLNEFSDFGVRGKLSILIIHKRFALHERFLVWFDTLV